MHLAEGHSASAPAAVDPSQANRIRAAGLWSLSCEITHILRVAVWDTFTIFAVKFLCIPCIWDLATGVEDTEIRMEKGGNYCCNLPQFICTKRLLDMWNVLISYLPVSSKPNWSKKYSIKRKKHRQQKQWAFGLVIVSSSQVLKFEFVSQWVRWILNAICYMQVT